MEIEKTVAQDNKVSEDEYHHLNTRISTLESTLTTFINSTDKHMASLEESVKEGDRHILNLIETLRNNTRTNWGNIAAWASVLVVLMGLVVYAPLQELRNELASHTEGGHPDSVISKLDSDEKKLTDRLNAKRDQLVRIETRLDRLEQEQAVHRSYNNRIEVVEEEIRKRGDIIVDVRQNESKTNERLLSLERMVHPHITYRSGRPEGSVPDSK